MAGYDLSPLPLLLLVAAAVASLALLWLWRQRRLNLHSLTLLALFLTFDLVLFGAFTRLSDSGLGCPDWPGCYGTVSAPTAHVQIAVAQAAMPTGPVTQSKAWIEMVHRYLAGSVGLLILVLAIWTWLSKRQPKPSPWWATATFAWVCLQVAFGALTVTMKLFPLIVTLHLLGGMGLVMLLAAQAQGYQPQPLALSTGLRRGVLAVSGLVLLQVALGGWVSTNYAVLACSEFPTCQAGQWWPAAHFSEGFTLWRGLGLNADGSLLPFAALTAIHLVHRIGALLITTVLGLLIWRLRQAGERRWSRRLFLVLLWQLISGLSNVVLGWPLVAALAHTGGAAMMLALLTVVLIRARQ